MVWPSSRPALSPEGHDGCGLSVKGNQPPCPGLSFALADRYDAANEINLSPMWVFPLLKSLLPVVVAFLLPTTDTLDHRRVGNGTHRHGLFQEPMEELPAMA